ncbi:S24/S26 family peptidase [Thermodesulfobacteriota bacterium]
MKRTEQFPLFNAHQGSSMTPVLRESDLLEVKPYRHEEMRAGDIVLFIPPGWEQHVVHRVTRITTEGIHTRGDAVNVEDCWILKPSDIIGRVGHAWQGTKRRKIAGGLIGRLVAWSNVRRQSLIQKAAPFLKPIYYSENLRSLLACSLPKRLKPRSVIFKKGERNDWTLLIGKRRVGRYDAGRRQWTIERPFRLFIDVNSLPPHPACLNEHE